MKMRFWILAVAGLPLIVSDTSEISQRSRRIESAHQANFRHLIENDGLLESPRFVLPDTTGVGEKAEPEGIEMQHPFRELHQCCSIRAPSGPKMPKFVEGNYHGSQLWQYVRLKTGFKFPKRSMTISRNQ